MGNARTVLEQKIRERRQTFEEFAEYAEKFAREHREPGTLSARHLQRLAAGERAKGKQLGALRPATARLLEHIFGLTIDELLTTPSADVPVEPSSDTFDLALSYTWLDEHAGWKPDTSRRHVQSRLSRLNKGELLDQHAQRLRVTRSQTVRALADYYPDSVPGYHRYRARCGEREIATSVLTRPEWLGLQCPLDHDTDRLHLAESAFPAGATPDETGAEQALRRLTEAAALDVRLANVPLYRLLDIDTQSGTISGSLGTAPFIEYALTMDLLESELVDALATPAAPSNLPLRDRYLPDMAAVLDLSGRLCVGGVLALCVVARPADTYRRAPDYALLVQQRSAAVLNAARRLSVIPKGFHQPLTDVSAEAPIGTTLRRELEEELFGRSEVDSTITAPRAAAPMHPDRLSEPMRWLTDDPARLRIECTGFGLNLVSGNYEFASLIVIDDEEFWARYGGHIEANWESAGLRLFSSRDPHLLTELTADESWTSEGVFALLQGLRRLRQLDSDRVHLPAVEPEGIAD